MHIKKDIFADNSNDVCMTSDALIAYAQGVSDVAATRKVELHVSDCMLCSDALDALLSTDIQAFSSKNEVIQQAIKKRYSTAKIIQFPAIRWAAAASVLLLLASYFYFSKKDTPVNPDTEIVTIGTPKPQQDTLEKTTINTDIASVESKNISIKSNFSATTQKEDIAIVAIGESGNVGFLEQNIPTQNEKTKAPKIDAYEDIATPSDGAKIEEAKSIEKNTEKAQENIGANASGKLAAPTVTQVTGSVEITPALPQTVVTNASGTYDMKDTEPSNVSGRYKVSDNAAKAKSTADAKKNIVKKTNYDERLQQGIKAYYRNNLKKALADFEAILALDTSNEDALFYKGLVLAADERCNDAMPILNNFAFYPNTSPYYSEAQWTIANCQLKTMMKESAKNILRILAEYDNLRQEDARKLLEKLK